MLAGKKVSRSALDVSLSAWSMIIARGWVRCGKDLEVDSESGWLWMLVAGTRVVISDPGGIMFLLLRWPPCLSQPHQE